MTDLQQEVSRLRVKIHQRGFEVLTQQQLLQVAQQQLKKAKQQQLQSTQTELSQKVAVSQAQAADARCVDVCVFVEGDVGSRL